MIANHPARSLTKEDLAEGTCTNCGKPVEGQGTDLRHVGEVVPALAPTSPTNAVVLRAAEQVATSALDGLTWKPGASNADRARAIVAALNQAGLLAVKRRKRSGHNVV